MNTDELRSVIWDELFQTRATKTIEEIAVLTDCDAAAVRTAVSHDWFRVAEDRVSIAMVRPESHNNW